MFVIDSLELPVYLSMPLNLRLKRSNKKSITLLMAVLIMLSKVSSCLLAFLHDVLEVILISLNHRANRAYTIHLSETKRGECRCSEVEENFPTQNPGVWGSYLGY